MFCSCFFRRPRVIRHPRVAAGLESRRLLYWQRTFVVQPVSKPWRFNFLPKINPSVVVERNCAQRFARAVRPATMIPRPDYQKVVVLLVEFFQPRIGHHWPEKIFLIPPSGHI